MRRTFVLLAIGFFQVCLFAELASAGALDFSDEFDSFDTSRWSEGNHNLGRSYLDPNNVDVSGGKLAIKLPANTLDGGEIFSNALYGHGSYAARIKVPNAPSSITGFFLYEPPDFEREVDIEIYNDSSGKILFTTYANGRQTHTDTMKLPFEPTAGFHEYRIAYAPGSAKFLVDGKVMKRWNNGIPTGQMRLYVNAWYLTWLPGTAPATDKHVLVDRIQHTQR